MHRSISSLSKFYDQITVFRFFLNYYYIHKKNHLPIFYFLLQYQTTHPSTLNVNETFFLSASGLFRANHVTPPQILQKTTMLLVLLKMLLI